MVLTLTVSSPGPKTRLVARRPGFLLRRFLAISLLFFFASFFDAFLGRSWLRFPSQLASQKSIKIQEKSMPRCHPSWTPFFYRFLVGFGSQLGPIWFKKLNFSLRKKFFFCCIDMHIPTFMHIYIYIYRERESLWFGKTYCTNFS